MSHSWATASLISFHLLFSSHLGPTSHRSAHLGHQAISIWAGLGGVVHLQAPIAWIISPNSHRALETRPIPFEPGSLFSYINYSSFGAQCGVLYSVCCSYTQNAALHCSLALLHSKAELLRLGERPSDR